jgi:hypothetical protein
VKTLLFAILSLLLWVGSAQADPLIADPLINEDYEVTAGELKPATQSGLDLIAKEWDVTCTSGPCPADSSGDIITSPVHGGSKALRYTFPTGDTGSTDRIHISRSFTGSDEIWGRFWMRWDDIVPGSRRTCTSPGDNCMKIHYYNAAGNDVISAYFGTVFSGGMTTSPSFTVQRNFNVTCPNGNTGPTCNYPPNTDGMSFPYSQWVCTEYHLKMNTVGVSNGVVEVWLGGVQTVQYTNQIFRDAGSAASQWKYMQVYRQGGSNLYRYEDDFMLSNSGRVGCGGAPPLPTDTIPPTAPSGVTVQ